MVWSIGSKGVEGRGRCGGGRIDWREEKGERREEGRRGDVEKGKVREEMRKVVRGSEKWKEEGKGQVREGRRKEGREEMEEGGRDNQFLPILDKNVWEDLTISRT